MSSIEETIQHMVPGNEGTISPLEPVAESAPVLTPVILAAAGGAVIGAGLWCAKHGCAPNEEAAVELTEDGEQLSADELLHGRTSALRG